MGLCIKVDLETSAGPTKEAYCRIDTYRVDKVTSRLRFAVTYWINQEAGAKFNRTYLEEDLKQAKGLFSNRVVHYPDQLSEGDEIDLPTFFDVNMAEIVTIEEPILEEQEVSKEVPYVSFDEEGEEVTKFRTVKKKELVQIGTKTVKKNIIDNSIIGDLPEYCYRHIEKELRKIFPQGTIINN
jgi:hypothetical protein